MSCYLKNFNDLKFLVPVYAIYQFLNEITVIVSQQWLQFLFFFIKNHINYQYKLLSCITGVDLLGKSYRYCVVYDVLSLVFNTRLRIKSLVDASLIIPTISTVFENANWWEREVWDLFGVFFEGHPDMRRILTDYGFEGHPMRKDFPLSGFVELRYNESKKKVIVEPVVLSQEYRSFTFEMPW
jgi:NADH:ubiquinone oxidoreductase subunit C